MIDGIIKGDGTSRKMKATLPATYEEFKQAVESGNQLLDILFNAAGWEQQPTFLNKQNLLRDYTASVLGVSDNPTVDNAIFAARNKKQLARITSSQEWTCPEGVTEIDVYMVGGGASGEPSYAGGGGFGKFLRSIKVVPGQKYPIIIGAGGKPNYTEGKYTQGVVGGETSAFGFSTPGGGTGTGESIRTGGCYGGEREAQYIYNQSDGFTNGGFSGIAPYVSASSITFYGSYKDPEFCHYNPYTGKLYGCGGGGSPYNGPGGDGGGGVLPGNLGGEGGKRYNEGTEVMDGQDGEEGCGGGGGASYSSENLSRMGNGGNGGIGGGGGGSPGNYSNAYKKPGNGGDGIVYIYG